MGCKLSPERNIAINLLIVPFILIFLLNLKIVGNDQYADSMLLINKVRKKGR